MEPDGYNPLGSYTPVHGGSAMPQQTPSAPPAAHSADPGSGEAVLQQLHVLTHMVEEMKREIDFIKTHIIRGQ